MKKIKFLILFTLLCSLVFAKSKKEYSIFKLSEDLKYKACAVVRKDITEFEIKSKSSANLKVFKAITILGSDGDGYANISISYDKLIMLKGLKIRIYDATGKLIKKVKSSEIKDYSAFDGFSLFNDNRIKTYTPIVRKYPYTIEYQYNLDYNGLFQYPAWYPCGGYKLAVEHSEFTIKSDPNFKYRVKECNLPNTYTEKMEKDKLYKKWTLTNFSALKKEDFSPTFSDFAPVLLTAPINFMIQGYEGKMNNWQGMGQWLSKLSKDRDILPVETVSKIKELTQNIPDTLSKVKKVYEYMQNRTRYVSIQVGIGGWQPFLAETVDKLGYGDCKALSNYTKALLKTIGIKSHYTLINASAKDKLIDKSFARNRFNHAILCVPLKQDTIWLECTSQKNPFGMLSSRTEDNDVLLIKNGTGELAHTKSYNHKDNIQSRKIEAKIFDNGNAKVKMNTKYEGLQYDFKEQLVDESKEEQKKSLYKNLDLNSFRIEDVSFKSVKENLPFIEEKINLDIEKYSNISGKHMFVPLNMLNKMDFKPSRSRNRKVDVLITFAYTDKDTVCYEIPKNFKVESLPENKHIVSDFGEYRATIKQEGNKVYYQRELIRYKGRYPAQKYKDLVRFYKKITNSDEANMVLTKI